MQVNEVTLKIYQQHGRVMHFLQVHQECALHKLGMRLWTLETSGIAPAGLRWLPTRMAVTEVSNLTTLVQAHLHTCITAPGIITDHPEVSACNDNHQLHYR